jgi:hypothetical protein
MINPSLAFQNAGYSSNGIGPSMTAADRKALESAYKSKSSSSSSSSSEKKDDNTEYEDVGVGRALLAGVIDGIVPGFIKDAGLAVYDKILSWKDVDSDLGKQVQKWKKDGVKGDDLVKKIDEWEKTRPTVSKRKKWRYTGDAKTVYNLTKYGTMIGKYLYGNWTANNYAMDADRALLRRAHGLSDKIDLDKAILVNTNTGVTKTGAEILGNDGLKGTLSKLLLPSWANNWRRSSAVKEALSDKYSEMGNLAKKYGMSEHDLIKEFAKPSVERDFGKNIRQTGEIAKEKKWRKLFEDNQTCDISHNDSTKGEVKVPDNIDRDYGITKREIPYSQEIRNSDGTITYEKPVDFENIDYFEKIYDANNLSTIPYDVYKSNGNNDLIINAVGDNGKNFNFLNGIYKIANDEPGRYDKVHVGGWWNGSDIWLAHKDALKLFKDKKSGTKFSDFVLQSYTVPKWKHFGSGYRRHKKTSKKKTTKRRKK